MAIRIIKKNILRITISFILILTIAMTQAFPSAQASPTTLDITGPAVNYTVQTRTVTFTDNDLPSPPIEGMTFHFVAPSPGEYGPGKIRLSYQALSWAIWFGVTDGKLWAYNLPKRESLPESLQGFYDSLGVDENTVYTEDGKCWFTGLPPWLDIAKYDPDVTELPTLLAVSSTAGQATVDYSNATGSISGHVLKSDGITPIVGALLTATVVNGTPSHTEYTTTGGSYTLSGLPSGNYKISAQAEGYLEAYYDGVFYDNKATPVSVNASDEIPNIDFILKISRPGDANVDGQIDMGDVIKVERVILGLDSKNTNTDANVDGKINMGDVIRIERTILGLP